MKQQYTNGCRGCKFLTHQDGHDFHFHEYGDRGPELIAISEDGTFKKRSLAIDFKEILK